VAECLERVAPSSSAANRFPDEVTSAPRRLRSRSDRRLLGRLRGEIGLSLLFITHDLALIRTIADGVVVMT
jgi:peptide/nickel transport system ATP-binding protein